MDIFFVLSGFLITDILLNTFDDKNYLRNFYLRRILRVFPLYYIILILFVFILPQVPGFPLRLHYYVEYKWWFFTFLQNWVLIFHQPGDQSALAHLWSMAVEEQFYLIWPLLVAMIRKPKLLLILMLLILFTLSIMRFWLWTRHIHGLAYYNLFLFTRIDGICIGCMVALLQKIDRKFIGKHMALIVLVFAIINFVFYLINLRYQNSFPYLGLIGFSTFSMIFGMLAYEIVNGSTSIFERLLNVSFLKFMGKVSYGTYIFHWPLFLLLNPILYNWAKINLAFIHSQFFASLVVTILAFGLGYLSYRFYETKFLNLKKYFA
jgi:peptidoglycan/LPS O-acetylase OafA/YrhL